MSKNIKKTLITAVKLFAIILALILIVGPWLLNLQNLAYSSSGIGLGVIILLIAIHRIKKSNNYKRIKPTLISGVLVLIIFTLVTLLPAYLRS